MYNITVYGDDENLKSYCEQQHRKLGDSVTFITRKGIFRTSPYTYKIPYKELHCENGPALIFDNHRRYWYRDGIIHREDGPAEIDTQSNYKKWYYNGLSHREDGPACVYNDDRNNIWSIHGENKTTEILKWIEENNLPNWKEWNDEVKLLFKLTWC